PWHLEPHRLHPVGGGDVGPAVAEAADAAEEPGLAGAEDVRDHRLEPAGAARGEEEDVVRGLQPPAEPVDDVADEHRCVGAAVVDHRPSRRAHHPLGDGGRSGDAKLLLEAHGTPGRWGWRPASVYLGHRRARPQRTSAVKGSSAMWRARLSATVSSR